MWQRGNVAALDDLLASDYIDHDPLPGFGADRAAARAMAAHVTSAMTDVELQIHHLITDGDLAAAHWTMTWRPSAGAQRPPAGPHQPAAARQRPPAGPHQPAAARQRPPAGPHQAPGAAAQIRLRGHDFFRLRHNRICEVWHCEAPAGPVDRPGQQAAE